MQKIILASNSPRRRQLLQQAGIPFEVIVSESDEQFPDGLPPKDAAVYIARNKALAVLARLEYDKTHNVPILAADTIVVLDGDIIGKPKNGAAAMVILRRLSGKKHLVITGVVIRYNEVEIAFSDITEVVFHPLSENQIKFYVENYRPFDKAGAYAIQEWIGIVGVKSINGDFYNVMGLPISRVLIELKKLSQ